MRETNGRLNLSPAKRSKATVSNCSAYFWLLKRALIDQGRIATNEYLDKPQLPLPEIKRLWHRDQE